ncbi:ATP-binding protein [Nostocaceae cyanobacterium CENA357]|uniref:ATP-binding protein n=1 Tax=Atlanticothrix silvestris CENA357 TaxID=1725252 RepID=A0A8J7HGQ0_9CYAN|nr:ATP-binding protein [Atlanticothrix silvestris]MBH8554686.1 ATP-binding protein [Atlanticothrix silvestris CENA357]
MTILTGFPLKLLEQSATERLAYFENYTVAHPQLKEVYETLVRTIAEPAGASFIFVYGPSGIGKTTLRLRVEQKLTELALPKLESARGCVPVVGVEAVAPESRNFNWKDYYTRALIALEEPLIDHKFNYGVRGIYRDIFGKINVESKVVAPALRRALENALSYRHPDVFFIDEAQHFGKMASGHKLQDQLDCLKSVANMTGILHCLLGTYELLTFRNLSGQLSRRSVDIHFRRYCADTSEDVQAFKSVLLTFQQQMPLADPPDLVTHWEYFYERTLGCVGILKNWLTRALKDALDREATTVTLKDLQKRAWSVAQCQRMFKEIQEGERQLSETDTDVQHLRSALGLGAKTIAQPEEAPKKTLPQGKVGKRNPKRDPIGVNQDVS